MECSPSAYFVWNEVCRIEEGLPPVFKEQDSLGSHNLNQKRKVNMPSITISISRLSKEIKAELVKSLTGSASEITGLPERAFTVYINEFDRDNIGVGGELLSERDQK